MLFLNFFISIIKTRLVDVEIGSKLHGATGTCSKRAAITDCFVGYRTTISLTTSARAVFIFFNFLFLLLEAAPVSPAASFKKREAKMKDNREDGPPLFLQHQPQCVSLEEGNREHSPRIFRKSYRNVRPLSSLSFFHPGQAITSDRAFARSIALPHKVPLVCLGPRVHFLLSGGPIFSRIDCFPLDINFV